MRRYPHAATANLWSHYAELLAPIRYTLRFPAPHTHYVEVEATLPTSGKPWIELAMAVWTPGSYLVREYARHIEGLMARAPDGTGLSLDKARKNRWRIHTNDAETIVVTYRVYCREMSVRTNWVEDNFALLNGAPTFLTLVEDVARPHDVQLVLPDAWQTSITGLPAAPDGRVTTAPLFRPLVDSPILLVIPLCTHLRSRDPHYLVNEGEAASGWPSFRAGCGKNCARPSRHVGVFADKIRLLQHDHRGRRWSRTPELNRPHDQPLALLRKDTSPGSAW
jgi:hypothetical protein